MTEIELKFQVGDAHRAALARTMATAGSRQQRLQAQYFDTDDRALARAGLALRVRKEGRRWVQTLKSAGDGLLQRLEHEVMLGAAAAGVVPQADPARHDGTPAGAALRRALGAGVLAPTYGTEVTRRIRDLRSAGCRIEVAFDRGVLWASGRRAPLQELEFELKVGDAAALVMAARGWVDRHGLTLDTRSKAERGDRLARGVTIGPPVKARSLRLAPGVDGEAALRAIVGNCLAQILGNASEMAHGDSAPEHLHQLRVGIRRLRSALRELGALSPQVDPGWATALEALFRQLGAARDRDALSQRLLPALHKAGAEALQLPPAEAVPPPAQLLREPGTTRLWLDLLAFAAARGLGGEAFAPLAAARLQQLHRQVRRDAARFEALDDLKRHRLRKRLKRLRYLCEFVASCFEPRAVQAYLKRVAPAQEALGEFNDVCVARALLQQWAQTDPKAMFALGWLAHEHHDAIHRCHGPLARLRTARPFW